MMYQKFPYIRDKKLMEAYRKIPCQHCGKDDGTVCGAHSNWGIHGHGRGIKASDEFCASLCADCHVPILDQGSKLSKDERKKMWWDAHVKTVRKLAEIGEWPDNVPVPYTFDYPF